LRITITAILAILFIFANFVTVRRMGYYAIEANFYDELSVAYNTGGTDGLKKELDRIALSAKMNRKRAMAEEFKVRLKDLGDPRGLIQRSLSEDMKKIALFRNLRSAAIGILAIILIFRISARLRILRSRKKG